MTNMLAQVTLPSTTGLLADASVNTFAINQGDVADGPDIAAAIIDFYNHVDTTGTGGSIASYFSPTVVRSANAASIKLYDIDALPAGSPFYGQSWTVGPIGSAGWTALPSEVALAVTLEAVGRPDAPVEGAGGASRPKQRRTGRIYLGPLNSAAVELGDGQARPDSSLRTLCRIHINRLDLALQTLSPTCDLAVWSRADNVVRSLGAVSTDNAFDTQRRRGVKATTRQRLSMTEA